MMATLAINKAITVTGADKEDTVLRGASDIGGTVILNGGATLRNLTVTRDNDGDEAAWAANANVSLVSMSNLSKTTTLDNCILTKGRNGVYMNNTYKVADDTNNIIPVISNNIITDTRTGINFCGDCSHAEIINNEITDCWTIGIVTYSNSAHSSNMDTITLSGNTIKGNWIAQILIKYDTTPPHTALPPSGSEITGIWNISDNIFDSPVTIARQYNQSKAEPAYNDQRPASVGGSSEKPSWTPPTIRIYNQPVDVNYRGMTLQAYEEEQ